MIFTLANAWVRFGMSVAASFDRAVGIRCPFLWACSRTYRDETRRMR